MTTPIARSSKWGASLGSRLDANVAWVGECLEWQGARTAAGYGQITIWEDGRRKSHYTHRVSLARSLGRELDGMALHRCDNPPCCNPDHLYEGDQWENMRGAKERDRPIGRPKGN